MDILGGLERGKGIKGDGTDDHAVQGRIPFIKDHAHCVLQPALTAALVAPGGPPPALPANPTAWPDAFFESLTPVFLIRHPARMVPSCLRAGQHVFGIGPADEDFRAQTSLGLARAIFDAYDALYRRRRRRRQEEEEDDNDGSSSGPGPDDVATHSHPLVVDAEDVIHHTEALLPRLCAALGLDPASVRYNWDPVPREQWGGDPIMCGFFGDVMSSSCVRRDTQAVSSLFLLFFPSFQDGGPFPSSHPPSPVGQVLAGLTHNAAGGGGGEKKPKEIHIVDKRVEWAAEFGDERAAEMVRRVEEEMPHYEYLRRFRLAV